MKITITIDTDHEAFREEGLGWQLHAVLAAAEVKAMRLMTQSVLTSRRDSLLDTDGVVVGVVEVD
jgi:hypothetical protein